MLGIVEHQRAHVVSRRGKRAPFQSAPHVRLTRPDDFVVAEAVGALVAVAEQQGHLVPAVDQRRLGFRQRDRASVMRLDRRVAADVVAVAVRVDQSRQRLVADPRGRREQRQRQRRVAHVAGVDQHVSITALEQHVVRRKPVADEDVHLRRQRRGPALIAACPETPRSARPDPRPSARRARCARDPGRRSGNGRPAGSARSACRHRTAAAGRTGPAMRSGPASILITPSGLASRRSRWQSSSACACSGGRPKRSISSSCIDVELGRGRRNWPAACRAPAARARRCSRSRAAAPARAG